tara:strand:- start:61 stop:390 length:330 start_codon:yes stop_codon:yes gene_type:complete
LEELNTSTPQNKENKMSEGTLSAITLENLNLGQRITVKRSGLTTYQGTYDAWTIIKTETRCPRTGGDINWSPSNMKAVTSTLALMGWKPIGMRWVGLLDAGTIQDDPEL